MALTFDDGPHPRYTHRILEILKKYNVSATFFVLGVNVDNYPDAFCEIVSSGHEIGNHTYSHQSIKDMSEENIRRELEKTEAAIAKHSDIKPTVFRPPQGAFGEALERVSGECGYDIILWSIDTKDWAHTPPGEIIQKVIKELDDGDIILMHDYVSGGNATTLALEMMIPKMLDLGYEFVTVSELISEK
ncbi:MAG: polysaccharide deacetylase family protein [Clostridia bacterium]|nr:polysaccharide deacetylase family protein [Clostridia bacterium]